MAPQIEMLAVKPEDLNLIPGLTVEGVDQFPQIIFWSHRNAQIRIYLISISEMVRDQALQTTDRLRKTHSFQRLESLPLEQANYSSSLSLPELMSAGAESSGLACHTRVPQRPVLPLECYSVAQRHSYSNFGEHGCLSDIPTMPWICPTFIFNHVEGEVPNSSKGFTCTLPSHKIPVWLARPPSVRGNKKNVGLRVVAYLQIREICFIKVTETGLDRKYGPTYLLGFHQKLIVIEY